MQEGQVNFLGIWQGLWGERNACPNELGCAPDRRFSVDVALHPRNDSLRSGPLLRLAVIAVFGDVVAVDLSSESAIDFPWWWKCYPWSRPGCCHDHLRVWYLIPDYVCSQHQVLHYLLIFQLECLGYGATRAFVSPWHIAAGNQLPVLRCAYPDSRMQPDRGCWNVGRVIEQRYLVRTPIQDACAWRGDSMTHRHDLILHLIKSPLVWCARFHLEMCLPHSLHWARNARY